jgi:hypothetical protein
LKFFFFLKSFRSSAFFRLNSIRNSKRLLSAHGSSTSSDRQSLDQDSSSLSSHTSTFFRFNHNNNQKDQVIIQSVQPKTSFIIRPNLPSTSTATSNLNILTNTTLSNNNCSSNLNFHKPLIVLINPKSGGKMGAKLFKKFCWLLNPRQVFDLTAPDGPKMPLHLYRNVPNLRLLVCGGGENDA